MKKILTIILAAVAVAFLTFSVVGIASGASTDGWSEISVPENLVIDDVFDLPDREVTVNGKSYSASVKLYYPDGSVVMRTGNFVSAKLSQAGVYRILFEARDGEGKRRTDEKKFTVADKLWRVTDKKSSAVYGHDSLATEGTNGLLVKLAKGDTLRFGKIIDISDVTRATELVKGFITPSAQGTYDFDRLAFTFTDAFNPEITLTIQGRRSLSAGEAAKGYSYWTAWGNGQVGSGYENGNFHHGDIWGTVYTHSFLAMNAGNEGAGIAPYPQPSDTDQFVLRFDPQEAKTYIGSKYMTDLDDPLLHDGEDVWSGFKSNSVYLSVKAYDYAGETANFCLTSVLGYDLTADNYFIEKEPPEIIVDVKEEYVDDNLTFIPLAVTGGSFPVPEAAAFDAYSGESTVKAVVYYNYADPYARINCLIENGRFKVENVGKYTIVYTASDAMGNVATKLYQVNAVSALEKPLSITVDSSEAIKEAGCGEKIEVAVPEISGGSGDKILKITAELDGEKIEIADGAFKPEKAGKWEIRYSVTDITDTVKTAFYIVNVTMGSEPVFTDGVVLPRYFIAGMNHILPEIYATDYSGTEKKNVLATFEITDKNGMKEYTAGDKYKPEVNSNLDEVVVAVKAGGARVEKRVKAIVCIEDELFLIERMFISADFATEKNDEGLLLSAINGGNATWEYANPVAAKNSSVSVEGVRGKDDFGTMLVTFSDSKDSEIAVTAKIVNVKGKNARVVFGNADREIVQGFGIAENVFDVSFNGTDFCVGRIAVKVNKTDFGDEFSGFPSGKVYISVKITEAAKGAGYRVKRIDNNAITNLSIDGTKPRIAINGDYGGMRELNDVYTVNSAVASDTFDPAIKFTLTVTTPSGKIASDLNGKELAEADPSVAYDVKLTESGQYKVRYVAKDADGNEGTLVYGINILNRIAPTVNLGSAPKTAKVGETVVLPEVTAKDDVTPSEKLIVYRTVRTPNGILTVLGNDTEESGDKTVMVRYSYTFLFKGEYRFMVLVMDEAGNQTLAEFTITVE